MSLQKSREGLQTCAGGVGTSRWSVTRAQFLSIAAGLSTLMVGCSQKNSDAYAYTPIRNELSEAIARDTMRFCFCAGITRGYNNGDCILVEYAGIDGDRLFGLIDAGHKIETQEGASTVVLDYLASHGVDALDFFVLTHQHSDHYGDAAAILNTLKVRTLYIKQYDRQFSGKQPVRVQRSYEAILKSALAAGTHVVGVDPRLVNPTFEHLAFACPSISDEFLSWLAEHPEVQGLCEAFNETNTSFMFGAANMKLYNWECWNELGGVWDVSGDIPHEVVPSENCNSLGLVARLGETSALFAGDMNNHTVGGWSSLGDEDRLATEIGHVDFFKLNHHGTGECNTVPFLNAILPCHVQITNDIYNGAGETLSWLHDHGVDYEYTTSDPVGTVVTLDGKTVSMAHEIRERFIRNGTEVHYLSTVAETAEEAKLFVVYHETAAAASTWGQLAELVLENASSWELNATDGSVVAESLRIDVTALNGGEGSSCIVIGPGQRVVLTADAETAISRSSMLTAEPLFYVEGELSLEGPIILDGKCTELGPCEASLIENYGGALTVSGAALINNCKLNAIDLANGKGKTCGGGAILSFAGVTRLCAGATVKGNSCILERDLASDSSASEWNCRGGGVAVFGGCLEVDGTTIEDNECRMSVFLYSDGDGSEKLAGNSNAFGGGIYHVNGVDSSWHSLILRNNSAIGELLTNDAVQSVEQKVITQGGGCWTQRSSLNISDSIIENNSLFGAEADAPSGAGIYSARSQIEIRDSRFEGNNGAAMGGAMIAKASYVTLLDCIFSNNVAKQSGGGMVMSDRENSRLGIVGCVFSGNRAETADGGALWCPSPTKLENSAFEGNSAQRYGGAIFANGGIHADAGCSFSGNDAKAGSDLSIGRKIESFASIEVEADVELSKLATLTPLDDGPSLSAAAYPCCSNANRSVIEIETVSRTGLASLTVNGEACHGNRWVADSNGEYDVVATDLAGRTTSQLLTL